MMSSLAEEKVRAREQWSQDPCGAEYEREHELGTREFFDTIERRRYSQYALVKVYSRKQARALFSCFREVAVEVEQLTREELRFLARVVSEPLLERLGKRIRWNVIIATK